MFSSQRRRTRIVRIHGEDHNMSSLFQAFATDIQSIKKKRMFNGLQSHLRLKKKKKKTLRELVTISTLNAKDKRATYVGAVISMQTPK